jgi:hypothetical protein
MEEAVVVASVEEVEVEEAAAADYQGIAGISSIGVVEVINYIDPRSIANVSGRSPAPVPDMVVQSLRENQFARLFSFSDGTYFFRDAA